MSNIVFTVEAPSSDFRTLNFIADGLGKQVHLLLVFVAPKNAILYEDLFPICWKVLSFTGSGINALTVEYTADTALFVPQTSSGNLVSASSAQRCSVGKICTLMTNDDGANYLTPAAEGDEGLIQCDIQSKTAADLGVGFVSKKAHIEPIFMWNDIGKSSTVAIKLTSCLKIYSVSPQQVHDYVESKKIKSDVKNPVFEKDLLTLPAFTQLKVTIDNASKKVVITQVDD